MDVVSIESKTINKHALCQTAIDALFYFIRRHNITECQQLDTDSLAEQGIGRLQLAPTDPVVIFSGKTLSQIPTDSREHFWDLVWRVKEQGIPVGFEPKYASLDWRDADDAKFQFDLSFQIADFVLLDLHKFGNLYGFDDLNSLLHLFEVYGTTELFISKPSPLSSLSQVPANDVYTELAFKASSL